MSEQKQPGRSAPQAEVGDPGTGKRDVHPQMARERQVRSDRLAAALRENLKRRKQRTRARPEAEGDEPT